VKLLIIEPDRILGDILKNDLEKAGHTVVIKRTAQTALDAVDNQPDLIILEIQLGLHNGIEFLYELRSYPEWQHIPAVVHTMNPHIHDKQFTAAFAELGIHKIFYKPHTTTNELLQAVAAVTAKP
jgi:CheY-like chemotaxis protein